MKSWCILLLTFCTLAACAPDEEEELSSSTINLVLGDQSWIDTHGQPPDATIDDHARIQTHLAYVEQKLRDTTPANLSQAQSQARAKNLDKLHDYWTAGRFPNNDDHADPRRPTFIDNQGAICAVGYLIEQDLGPEAVARIAANEKYDYIAQIDDPALQTWQKTTGLTMRELAMIQPTYGHRPPIQQPPILKPPTPPPMPTPPPPPIRNHDISALVSQTQPHVDTCINNARRRKETLYGSSFRVTLQWSAYRKAKFINWDLYQPSQTLQSCLITAIERHMDMPPHPSYRPRRHQAPLMSREVTFSIPRPSANAGQGPQDLRQGLQRIDTRARACFSSDGKAVSSTLVPLKFSIHPSGRVSWAKIAPQHHLLGVLRDPQVYQCILKAAQSEVFKNFKGSAYETRLHLSIPSPR